MHADSHMTDLAAELNVTARYNYILNTPQSKEGHLPRVRFADPDRCSLQS